LVAAADGSHRGFTGVTTIVHALLFCTPLRLANYRKKLNEALAQDIRK